MQPASLQVHLLDQQVRQFADAQAGLRQREVDGERPV
jgi:hypothetical protein